MPRKRPDDPNVSKQGSLPRGQVQQTIQVPERFRDLFREEAGRRGHSSVKNLGTLAIGLLLGMPLKARHALYMWISSMTSEQLEALEPEDVYTAFARVMRMEEALPDDKRVAWLVTQLFDPELDLPPTESKGGKLSK